MAGITQLAADNLSQIWKGEFRPITMCVQTEIGAKAVMFPAKFCLDKIIKIFFSRQKKKFSLLKIYL